MKIEVKYHDDKTDSDIIEVIERNCKTKQQAEQESIAYSKSKGSRYFPFFRVLE